MPGWHEGGVHVAGSLTDAPCSTWVMAGGGGGPCADPGAAARRCGGRAAPGRREEAEAGVPAVALHRPAGRLSPRGGGAAPGPVPASHPTRGPTNNEDSVACFPALSPSAVSRSDVLLLLHGRFSRWGFLFPFGMDHQTAMPANEMPVTLPSSPPSGSTNDGTPHHCLVFVLVPTSLLSFCTHPTYQLSTAHDHITGKSFNRMVPRELKPRA